MGAPVFEKEIGNPPPNYHTQIKTLFAQTMYSYKAFYLGACFYWVGFLS